MRRPAPTILLTAMTTVALALTGCSAGSSTAAGPSTTAGQSPGAPDTGTFPVTVEGTTLTTRPERIVSLSATATDMLFAIGAGAQVVAVDSTSDYPANAPKTDLSAYKPSAEAIAAKNPDLVVISNDTNKITAQLTALKIPVFLAPAAVTIDDTYREETEFGALTGHVRGAAATVATEQDQIKAALATLPNRTKPLTYYYELDQTLYSVTSKTFIGSLFGMAGMVNVADPADADGKAFGYPQLSAESVIKANPDLIFLADARCCQQSLATVKARPGWATLSAVQNGRVTQIDDDIASQWGTRVPELLTAIVQADQAVPTQ